MKHRGGSTIVLLITLLVIIVAIMFSIPFFTAMGDKNKIKRALNQTKYYMQSEVSPGMDKVKVDFFRQLDKIVEYRRLNDDPEASQSHDYKTEFRLDVGVLEEDFSIDQLGNGRCILRCRYVNEHVIVPILKIQMGAIDKYIETEEFQIQ